jgi:Na+-transporting NADH:ubiquinone oxidoreductase subunit A
LTTHRIRKGLDLPIAGAPEQVIHDGPRISRVALVGDDTPGLRARLAVAEGDPVRRGQLLFEDRARPGVRYTAPGAGRVAAIFRGRRRMLRSVVIELSERERAGEPPEAELAAFESWRRAEPQGWSAEQVRALLLESGLWVALRTRPFGKVPEPGASPHALFVTAIDTNPLAPDPRVVLREAREDFQRGLRLLAKLSEGPTYLCIAEGSGIGAEVDAPVQVEQFRGPHPAGNPGVHIHLLAPASRRRSVWHLGYQDVVDVGRLFATGRLPAERIVSLAGPVVARPRLLRTRLGASIDDLTRGEIRDEGREVRLLSGSVLSGKRASGPELGFLGRVHVQVSALAEGGERHLLGWAGPGPDRFSVLPVFAARLLRRKTFDLTTDTHGCHRALMPIGTYERVMPMDILATYLLRALVVGDIEQAEKLGALELDEEDLALCTFVCPGKTDFGPYLRKNLERIEKEG